MKALTLGIQNNVTNIYDATKTTIAGSVKAKTISSSPVLGPDLSQYIDCMSTMGIAPIYTKYKPNTNRLFVIAGTSTPITIAFYNRVVNSAGNTWVYQGKVFVYLPNAGVTTHTISGFDVDDRGSFWQAMFSTKASVPMNGGVFLINKLQSSDFIVNGRNVFMAQQNDQTRATYFLQDDVNKGVNNNLTTTWGIKKFYDSSDATKNTKMYGLNNTAGNPQVFAFDMSVAPAIADNITGISNQTTSYSGTVPGDYFTSGATNHNWLNGTPVIFVGSVPTGITASNPNGIQVVYFIRDIQLISDQYYFNVASTSGGVAIVPSTALTGTINIMRAFGTCTNLFYGRTNTSGFGLSLNGSVLNSNVVDYANPISAPANTALQGSDCLAFCTSQYLHMGKVSELFVEQNGTSSGNQLVLTSTTGLFAGMAVTGAGVAQGTIISSIVGLTVNLNASVLVAQPSSIRFVFGTNLWASITQIYCADTGTNFVDQGIQFTRYSSALDSFVFLNTFNQGVIKKLINGLPTAIFGSTSSIYTEGSNTYQVYPFAMGVSGGIECVASLIFISSIQTNQRGIIITDIGADKIYGTDYIISAVNTLPQNSIIHFINLLIVLRDYTNTSHVYIRSSANSSDSIFASASGGWIELTLNSELNYPLLNPYFQIKIDFNVMNINVGLPPVPAQIQDALISYTPINEISDNWEGSVDNTSINGSSPARTAFRLIKQYAVSVPKLFFRAYDDNGNLLAVADTVTSPTMFEYTTNNGLTWNSLGTIANVINTTELRYNWTTPAGVNATCSLREI